MLNHKDYTIAWIAVLPIEAEAAVKALERRHDGSFPSTPGDHYLYTAGELFGHNVVIATLPAGQNYGVGAAAALASHVKARFSNIWFTLLVGVAAGLPNYCPNTPDRHRDIRLGDVLVCLPDKTSTGIVQYDLGTDTGADFTPSGRQAETPAIVRSAIGNIRLLHERPYANGNILANYLRALQDKDGERKFERPALATDQLFETSLNAVQPTEIMRILRGEDEQTQVWYGNIGSGNSLMRNPSRRDELRDRYNLLGLEMEAAGVVHTLPAGVIRGVCDYGDGHKSKLWQPYAAAVAAVYAKGILATIAPKKIRKRKLKELRTDRSQESQATLTKEDKGRSSPLEHITAVVPATEVLGSLAFTRMGDRRLNVRPPHEGTCRWILDSHEYRDWDFQPRGLLWVKGKPGAGKSTIMSFIYTAIGETLVRDDTVCLEFFFSARGELLQHSFLGMLRSLLNQLYGQDPRTRLLVRQRYVNRQVAFGDRPRVWDWQQEELKQLLEQAILLSAEERQMFIFVDALDEAGEEAAHAIAEYFHKINDLVVASSLAAKICISCRHYPFTPAVHGTEISVEDHNRSDITAYVQEHIRRASLRSTLDAGNPSCEQEWDQLAEYITLQAKGVFQWVSLVLPTVTRSIRNGLSPIQTRQRLSKVPEELFSTYEYILQHVIDRENIQRSFLLFQWVCFAERPLNVTEIRYALAAHDALPSLGGSQSVRTCDTEDFVATDYSMELQIRALSGGLLENMGPDGVKSQGVTTVQVVHQTVKEFLMQTGMCLLESLVARVTNGPDIESGRIAIQVDPTGHEQRSHALLYRSCLQYLATELADTSIVRSLRQHRKGDSWIGFWNLAPRNSALFLRYAASFVFNHARKAGHCHRMSLRDQFVFLHQTAPYWDDLSAVYGPYRFEGHQALNVLHVSTAAGLIDLVAYSLDIGISVDDRTEGRRFTPLHFVATEYNESIFMRLIAAKADLESRTADGMTPVLLAAKSGQAAALQQLLTLGIEINTRNDDDMTALMLASEGYHVETVQLLLEYGANVNLKNRRGTALMLALDRRNSSEIVRLLLRYGADPNIQDTVGWTALMVASSIEQEETMELLLQHKANINAQEEQGKTALMIASRDRSEYIVRLLLEYGADTDVQDGNGETALMLATGEDREEIVRLLLQYNAAINVQNEDNDTALMIASSHGNTDIIHQLLQCNAILDIQDGEGNTVLARASAEGDETTVRMLLEHRPAIDIQNDRGKTALILASENDHEEIVQILNEYKAAAESRIDHSDSGLCCNNLENETSTEEPS